MSKLVQLPAFPHSPGQQVRNVRQLNCPVSPPKVKSANPAYRPTLKTNKFISFLHLDFVWQRKEPPKFPQPQLQEQVHLIEDEPEEIEALGLMIGEPLDIATITTVELLQKKSEEQTDIELYLNVQAPKSGEESIGKVSQANIYIGFSDPVTNVPIHIKKYFCLDEQTPVTQATFTESEEKTRGIALTVAQAPQLIASASQKDTTGATVANAQIVTHSGNRIPGQKSIRWVVELNRQVSSLGDIRLHRFRHRIGRHLPVKANIRVTFQCGKSTTYGAPGTQEDQFLEIVLIDGSKS